MNELSPRFLADQPTAGMIYLLSERQDKDTVPTSFIYFAKLKRPVGVAALPGLNDVYRLTVACALDPKIDAKLIRALKAEIASYQFHVAIFNGRPVLLREHAAHQYDVGKGKNRQRFSRVECQYPRLLQTFYKDAKREKRLDPETTIEQYAAEIFFIAANFFDDSMEGFQVRAESGGISAAFNVALRRTSHFFRNRDLTELSASGQRKKIFHYVAEHRRATAAGRTTTVRDHYRGERRFTWSGYKVTITCPEKALRAFNIAAVEIEDDKTEGMLGMADVAEKVRDYLEADRALAGGRTR